MKNIEDQVKKKLKKIEEKENVKVLLAVESGSRAWGFASKDSDFDIRFIYLRKQDDYLKLEGIRDVIEWQLDDTFDINGWDLNKALRLIYASNPSIFEWLNSPIVYKTSDDYLKLKELSKDYVSYKKLIMHYVHFAKRNYRVYFKTDIVKYKRYLYVLRGILTSRYILENKDTPPMLFDELIYLLPTDIKTIVNDLLDNKKSGNEIDNGSRFKLLDVYIENELNKIVVEAGGLKEDKNDWKKLDDYFIKTIKNTNF